MSSPLFELVNEIFTKIREPLGLDRHEVGLVNAPATDCTASCEALPEYRRATLSFDLDKMQTGVDVQEIVVHEAAHVDTWELHTLAEELADALAESAPRSHRRALRKLLREKVRQAGERCTTDVGHTYLRLLRRAGILDTPAQDD